MELKNQGEISRPPEIAQKMYCMQNLLMVMNFDVELVNMYFAALWPELLSQNPVSSYLGHPAHILS
jgi:hypothetical protein